MLDIKRIRENPEAVKKAMETRGITGFVDKVLDLDTKRREIIVSVEQLKAKRNETSKNIPMLKKEGKDVASIMQDMKILGEDIKQKDIDLLALNSELREILLKTPNLPGEKTPVGKDESENVEIKKIGY